MPDVRITEFTDPGCPWAFSAEPFRRRLDWLYGDAVEWVPRMVVLSESPEEYEAKGLEHGDAGAKGMKHRARPRDADRHRRAPAPWRDRAGLPRRRRRPPARAGARRRRCCAALRVRTIRRRAARRGRARSPAPRADAGLDPTLPGWATTAVEAELREDMAAARRPSPAARVLDARLANWSGGRRYTCPSYEITRLSDGVTIAVPGFQPFAAYDVVLANLVPGRRPPRGAGVRRGGPALGRHAAGHAEVATVCEISRDEAREALGRRRRPSATSARTASGR